jgi:ATP-binding cassette subfamily B protein
MSKNALVYLFSKTWKHSVGNRRNIVLYWIMFVISECINTWMTPIVTAQIISVVATKGITPDNIGKLYFLIVLLMVRNLLSWAAHGPARVLEQINAFFGRYDYRGYLLKGVLNMPLEWHVGHHSGDITDKMNKGADRLFDFSEDSFIFIKSIVKLVCCFSMILYFNLTAAVIVAIVTVVSMWISIRFDRLIVPNYKALSKMENQINENIVDSIANITTVVILRVEKLIFDTIMDNVMKPFDLFKKTVILNELKWFVTSVFCDGMTVAALMIYMHDHLGTGPSLLGGSVFLLLSYLEKMGELFYQFTNNYGRVIQSKFCVLNAEELASEFQEESMTNHTLPESWKKMEIRNLTFSYHGEGGKNLHLDDIALEIKRGERIAFIGKRGSGKSTCLGVMRDLYHPQNLELLVDGEVMLEGFKSIKQAISLVPQNPEIFGTRDCTIGYNMTIGVPYDSELIDQYVRTTSFGDVLLKLPKGMDSGVKEKGVNLSGGEKQGLALIRGLLASHDKEIVLLDEPTSSFDSVTERQVYQNIFREFAGKTIISSVHKLHLLPYFDRIYMFSNGKVAASGTLSELQASSLEFQGLWQAGTTEPD